MVQLGATNNPIEWAKMGEFININLVGKETVCIGAGCHLLFMNLKSYDTKLYTANNADKGDGIGFFTGHNSLDFFGFSENCGNPNIFIYNFPDFKKIALLKGGCKEGYISLAFSESSLFVSLGSLPFFTVTVWNWRTGEKLGVHESVIFRQNQKIRCNIASPVCAAQLGVNTTSLSVWNLLMCGTKCVMTQQIVRLYPVKPLPLTSLAWHTDGSLYVCDKRANVFQVNLTSYTFEKIIECPYLGPGSGNPYLEFYQKGLVVAGPGSYLRVYVKNNNNVWNQEKEIPLDESLVKLKNTKHENMIGVTERKGIIKINIDDETTEILPFDESEYVSFCLIYPTGEYIAALCHNSLIVVFEVISGKLMSKFNLMGTALSMATNTEFPYVGVGYVNGILELISIYNPSKPVTMCTFQLTHNPLSTVHFSEFGRVFVCGDLAIGQFFIIEGIPGSQMKVISCVNTNCQVADYILVPSSNCYRLFVIPVTQNEFIAGNKIIRYCVTEKNVMDVREYFFKDLETLYCRLCSTSRINRDRVFYALPFGKKIIHEVEVRRGDDTIRIINTIETGHQIRKNTLYIDKNFSLTWGYDGFVMVRSANFDEFIGMSLSHHRRNAGVKKAFVDPHGKYIISLGNDNVLCCTNLIDRKINQEKQEHLKSLSQSARFSLLFQRKTIGFELTGDLKNYNWIEIEEIKQAEIEEKKASNERKQILREFDAICRDLRNLVTENINGPDIEKIDLAEFNLDSSAYNELKEANRIECKDTEIYLKEYIAAQQKVCEWIKTNCWDSMEVPKITLYAIAGTTFADNFASRPRPPDEQFELEWITLNMEREKILGGRDTFFPWEPVSEKDILKKINEPPKFGLPESVVSEEEDDDHAQIELTKEHQMAMSGTMSSMFIDTSTLVSYSQFELQTYFQLYRQDKILLNERERLIEFFNKEFDNCLMLKQRELNTIKEKNFRLRHIVSEINYFSVDKMFIAITDQDWIPKERPSEEIIKTDVKEIPIERYVSPEEQAIINANVEEEERIRLLLLADDFRERALMTMMNGVLEVRWEDELKKEVPLPKCMLEKDPENFNEEDLRAVRDYEEKVKFLNSERERYKNLLDQEYQKVSTQMREGIRKFNSRLSDLVVLRLKVDAALNQTEFIIARMKLMQRNLTLFEEKEQEYKKTIVENDEVVKTVTDVLDTIHDTVNDFKYQLDTFTAKEKNLEKAFKKEFIDASPVVQEQTYKLYKKRPRVSFKTMTSHTLLTALAKCVMNAKERPLILTQECHDFLASLDTLDKYIGVPPTVDEACYAIVVRLRRSRIEHEIKVRSVVALLNESDMTIQLLQRRLDQKKEQNVECMSDLQHVRTERLNLRKNMQLQIVLRQGLVEIPMTGFIKDFEDAVLVARSDVEEINKIIQSQGHAKLKSMRHTMAFRRKIMRMEWEHKKFRMQIEDLKLNLEDIHNVKVTKEMQSVLKGKEKTETLDVEIENLKRSYQNIIEEKRAQVAELRTQIHRLKDKNRKLDEKITSINVDVCELNLEKDGELEKNEKNFIISRTSTLLKRSKLIKEIQENHNMILVLQTELELLRLRTFPTLKYKIF